MAEVSIIEFLVYALIGYTGVILLVASAFRDVPTTKSGSVIRAIWVLPCIFAVYMLGSAGADIWLEDTVTVNTIKNLNSTETFTETIQKNSKITLYQPVWVTLHLLFFIMLIIYFIWNMLQLLVKRE